MYCEVACSCLSTSLGFFFYSPCCSLSFCSTQEQVFGFQRHVCLFFFFFGSFNFVNFDTVPILFSLMSLLRDSKGNLAMSASLDRRLANSSLLYRHAINVFLSFCLCIRTDCFIKIFSRCSMFLVFYFSA